MGTRGEELDTIEREKKLLSNQASIMGELRNVQREIQLLRAGIEAGVLGEHVEEMDDVETEEILPYEEVEAKENVVRKPSEY